jgi:hypothetical protein
MRKRTLLALTLTVILAAAAALALGGCGKKAPTLSSVSPASEVPGGKVTLSGSDFGDTQEDSKVQVGQETAAVESWSGSSIVILVPSGMEPGIYQASVTTSGGTSGSLPFQVAPAPAPTPPQPPHISSIQPTSGPSNTLVTIYGSSFGASQGGGRVNIGAVQMVMVSWSDIKIVVNVPPTMGVGQYEVSVTNSNGTSNVVAFIVTAQVEDQQLQEQAVQENMVAQGINPGDWVYKDAKVSASDPTWALLVYQKYEGMAYTQYLLHKVNGTWTVVASGGDDFNPQAYGAPADLKYP